MSGRSSIDLQEPSDISENPDIKLVKSSYLESSQKLVHSKEKSFDGISSISAGSKPEAQKNFIKKNIEITKKKEAKTEVPVNIEELLAEEIESRKPVDVDERFYKYQNKVQEKIQHLAKELKDQESKVCTFKPEIKSQTQRRTPGQFIDQMKNFEKKKQDKIEAIRQQRDLQLSEEVHKPVINPRSKEILSKKPEEAKSVHEKLYQQAKPAEKSPQKEKKVLKKIASENHLYEDALKRAARQIEVKQPYKEIQISQNSQMVLVKKFMKEFQEVFTALNGETEHISVELATKGLVCLNFIRNNPEHPKFEEEKALVDRFFKLIGATENVKIENLLKICLAVINIYTPNMTLSSEKGPFGVVIDGNYSINKEEVIKVHKLFSLFYENRQLSSQVIKEIAVESYPFRPQITPSTQIIAKQAQQRSGSLYSSKRENFIQEEKRKTQEKIEKIKKDREEEEAKHCTFKPTLISKSTSKKELSEKDRRTALYEKSKEINEKKKSQAKNFVEHVLEKDLNECTFAPKLERIKVKEDSNILNSKSVQNQLSRMQKARDEQERKRNILERTASSKALSDKKQSLRSPKYQQFKVSHFIEDYDDVVLPEYSAKIELPEKEMMKEEEEIQLEVKLPNGKVKTLVIPPGGDKELKLAMFIIENRLTEEMGKKLRESLLSI